MHFDLCDLALIGINVFGSFRSTLGRLFQVFLLTFPQFVCVLDCLFDPGDLGTGFVILSLYVVEFIGALALADPYLLNVSFDLALLRIQGFQRRFFLSQIGTGLIRALIEFTQLEC